MYYGGRWSIGRHAIVLSAVGEPLKESDFTDELVLKQAREALNDLHAKGVAHRDLHEGNNLIDRTC